MGVYNNSMDDCIFCKIAQNTAPNYRLYEDDDFAGFLDIFPVSKGHSVLIPKKHVRWTYDVENFGEYWEAAKKVSVKIQKALGASWMQFVTHGQIPHAHIHIIPRFDPIETAPAVLNAGKTLSLSTEEMVEIHQKITSA